MENVSLVTFPFFGTVTEKTQLFLKETNKSHPKNEVHGRNMKINNEITFLDTTVFKGEHLTEKFIFIGHQIPL